MKSVLLLITPSSPGRFTGIAAYAREHGWHLTVADRLTHTFRGWSGDGALVTLRDDDSIVDYARSLRRRHIPVVDLSASRPEIALPRVAGDNPAIGRLAAAHFHSRNFHNLAWFSTSWGHQHAERFQSFSESNSSPTALWCWQKVSESARSDDWHALSRWLSTQLKAAPKPLGIFCYDDADASRVESVAMEIGLNIPDEVAILGTGDDIPLCEAQAIPISSIRHDLEQNGREGAILLDHLMNFGYDARKLPAPRYLPPRGVAERQSTDAFAASSPIVKAAIEIYRTELKNPPSTEMLAERLHISRATLDRAFAAEGTISPAQMLIKLRLHAAKRLLKTTTLPLNEISARCGYCNPAYFTNTFIKFEKVPPRVWQGRRIKN